MKKLILLLLLSLVSPVFADKFTPIPIVFKKTQSHKTAIQFTPVKISQTSDFGALYIEIRGRWDNAKGKDTVVEILAVKAKTMNTKPASWKIENLGGLLPPEEVSPVYLRGKDSFPVYYGIQAPRNTSKIMQAALSGGKIFLEILLKVGPKKGKIILPGFTLASLR